MKTPTDWPDYCCAILQNAAGLLLLEERPPDAARAPGTLTCFGGRREPGETPADCIARELREELTWAADRLDYVLCMTCGPRVVAWFYRGRCDAAPDSLRTEPGRSVRLVAPTDLAGVPVSRWHRAALAAFFAVESAVEVEP